MKALIVATLAVVLAGGAYALNAHGSTIKVPQTTIQSKLEPLFPVIGKKLFVDYRLKDPVVDLRDNGRIGFTADALAHVKGRTVDGQVTASGVPEYDPEAGAFFLRQLVVEQLTWGEAKITEGDQQKLGAVMNKLGLKQGTIRAMLEKKDPDIRAFIGKMAGKKLAKQPIYTLKQEDLKQKMAKLVLNDVRVKENTLLLDLSLPNMITNWLN